MRIDETPISSVGRELAAAVDAYLLASPFAYAYHRPAWTLAIRDAYGFDTDLFTASEGERLVGMLQATHHRGLRFRTGLCSLPYCDFGGVVADNERATELLVGAAVAAMRRHRYGSLELREVGPDSAGPDRGQKASLQLALPETTEALMSGFKAKLRSQIRKARKNGLQFWSGRGSDAIRQYHAVYARNMRDLGSPPHAVALYDALERHYGDDFLVGLVRYEGRCVGAGILLFCGQNVSIPWASTLREYNRLAPNMLLYAELLNVAIQRGCATFDFGRSDVGGGTFRFKRQWGAEARALDWRVLTDSGSSWQPCDNASGGRGREVLAGLWSQLPVSVSTFAGTRLRRRISL